MYEVEQKFRVQDPQGLRDRLIALGAERTAMESHADTYFNHPCREFAETREALRVRRVDGRPSVTYKGTKLPGAIKARRELEWRLDPGDADGGKMEELLDLLGFQKIATVRKKRETFAVRDHAGVLVVTIDQVDELGIFAEIEVSVASMGGIEGARVRILAMAERLALREAEAKSYLRLLMERLTENQNI